MTHARASVVPRLVRLLPLSLFVLASCQVQPPGNPEVEPPAGAPSAPPASLDTARPPKIGPQPPVEHLPKLVRPEWDGTRHEPVSSQVRAYPTTWKGNLTVQDLAMVGQNLYSVDRGLQAVPLEGGQWSPVAMGGVSGLTRLASDGQHLYAGTSQGQVVGLDPANGQSATLASLPSPVTALKVGQNVLWAGTERDGIYRVPLTGGSAQSMSPGSGADRRVQDLALGNQVVYTLGDRLYAWPMDGSAAHGVPGTEGATSLTSYRGVAYVGTADGWLLRSKDDGASTQLLGQMVTTALDAVGTDGAWLYSSSGNNTYMLDLKGFSHSPCHAGFPATVANLTVLDGTTVLVGTFTKGLTSMPR
ncbi:MAG TPA: hypothetical protein V6D05_17735 [Stenomitos sp.]